MKTVTTKIRNESTKEDYCKVHAEDGIPMIEAIEKICCWILEEGGKEGNTSIPDDIYEEADNLLAIHDSAWKRL